MHELPRELAAGLADAVVVVGIKGVQLAVAADRLSDRYRADTPAVSPILADPVAVAAYLAVRMPATYAAVRFCLGELARVLPEPPATVLDVGAGTGAATWAAADTFDLIGAHLVDSAPRTLDAAVTLLARSSLATTSALGRADDPSGWPAADLGIAGYLLSELTPSEQAACVDGLAARCPTVVVVEPGTPAGYARVLAARDRLLAAGMTVAAPCPHDGVCPMSDAHPQALERDDWCHVGVRLTRSAAHRRAKGGDLGWEDEKLSWVAATRQPVADRPSRVVHRPRPGNGHVKLVLCTPEDLVRKTVVKKHGAVYRQARDAVWGGPAPTG